MIDFMEEFISWIVSIASKIAGIFNSDKNKDVRNIKINKFEHNNNIIVVNGDYLSKDQLTDRGLKEREADKKNETEI